MDFPATLPSPLRDGYAGGPLDRVERADFEAGHQRRRRTSAAAPTRVDVRWRFSLAQMAIFQDWYANDIGHGADAFTVSLANGLGMSAVTASFEEAYRATPLAGLRWDVTAALRVVAFPILTAEGLDVASAYAPADLLAARPALHTLIHTTLPGYW